MTVPWMISYVVLWLLVVVAWLLLVGTLRQIGMLRRGGREPANASLPALEDEGPALGSALPDLTFNTLNGLGSVSTAALARESSLAVVFITPTCQSCQQLAAPLNDVAQDRARRIQPLVFIMAHDEQACQAYLNVFPLHMPVVWDRDNAAALSFGVHRTPFGLLYDENGTLARKGVLNSSADLPALFGDASAPMPAHIFPQLA